MSSTKYVCLNEEATDVEMQTGDCIFFELKVDGMFRSSCPGAFNPPLPHDRHFKANSEWPDRTHHPDGARPMEIGAFPYTWTRDSDSKKLPTQSPGTIHVGSGMGNR